jgi:hypothetical protein
VRNFLRSLSSLSNAPTARRGHEGKHGLSATNVNRHDRAVLRLDDAALPEEGERAEACANFAYYL